MEENEKDEESTRERGGGVGPEKTHEATTPPGTGDTDERAFEEAKDKLDQASGAD